MRDRIVSGEAIRTLRVTAELYQSELASRAGLSESFIRHVERERTQPNDVNAHKIARALGCSVEDFSSPKPAAGCAA